MGRKPPLELLLVEDACFDETLANRTCQDRWLGGMLDAGMDGGAQAGTIIVYYLKDVKGTNIRISAIGQCHGGKRSE